MLYILGRNGWHIMQSVSLRISKIQFFMLRSLILQSTLNSYIYSVYYFKITSLKSRLSLETLSLYNHSLPLLRQLLGKSWCRLVEDLMAMASLQAISLNKVALLLSRPTLFTSQQLSHFKKMYLLLCSGRKLPKFDENAHTLSIFCAFVIRELSKQRQLGAMQRDGIIYNRKNNHKTFSPWGSATQFGCATDPSSPHSHPLSLPVPVPTHIWELSGAN